MKKLLFALVLFSCNPDVIQPNEQDQMAHMIGNTLFRWKLTRYKGPDTNGKWIYSDSTAALKDDGIVFKFTGYEYYGTIYQGPLKYWPGKLDITFPVTYQTKTTFKLGDDSGYNIATYDGEGETLRIVETYPVSGREYEYVKTSD